MGGDGQIVCVNKGTDWDSDLAQDTEHLAHAKIAVRAWAWAFALCRGCALVLMVGPPFSVVRPTCRPQGWHVQLVT